MKGKDVGKPYSFNISEKREMRGNAGMSCSARQSKHTICVVRSKSVLFSA